MSDTVNRANVLAWVEALESGRYTQGTYALHNALNDSFCCLGVACDLAFQAGVVTRKRTEFRFLYGNLESGSFLPDEVYQWLGIFDCNPMVKMHDAFWTLAGCNDHFRLSFTQIAALIRAQYLPPATPEENK